MELKDAIALIQHDNFRKAAKQSWADLGCGSGLFTYALASMLPAGSTIYAIDKNPSILKKINPVDTVDIKAIQADFSADNLMLSDIDGILMANSLHYINDKAAFIEEVLAYLKPENSFLIIEYDTDTPVSTWVPYPISFHSLEKLFVEKGYSSIRKLHIRPSAFNNGNIYSAIINR